MQMQKFKGVYIFLIVLFTFFCKPAYSQSAVAICLNEYQVTNFSGAPAVDNYSKIEDWVELYNNFTGTVSLAGYYLSNDRFNLKKWQFPSTYVMKPGDYGIVWMSGRNETKITNGLHHMHTNFKIDQCKADQWIILTNPQGVIRDSICIQKTQANHTRGRLNSPLSDYVTVGIMGWKVYTSPTFSAVNNLTPWIDYCPTPRYTEPPGLATITSPTFELFHTFWGTPIDTSCYNIWFTMDGSYPYPSSPNPWGPINTAALQYVDPASPLIAPPTQMVMFRAVTYPKSNYSVTPATPPSNCELNYLPSFCETNTYFCEAGVLPSDFSQKFGVLSLAIDDGASTPPTMPPLWFQVGTPERTVHVEYFDLQSKKVNYFELEGYAGLTKPFNEAWMTKQKGFNLNIDDRRGFGCNFEKQIFNVPELGTSTRTVFANLDVYGGDFESHSFDFSNTLACGTGLRDVFIQTLAAKNNLKVNPLHYKPVAVFINARYIGTFNFKEVFDADYEAFYNQQLEKEKTTMLFYHATYEGSVQVHPSTNNWKGSPSTDLYTFASGYPFSTTSTNQISVYYNQLKTRLDIPSFIDWSILNSYMQNSNLFNYDIAFARGSNTLTAGGRWHHYLWNMPSSLQFTCISQNGYYNVPTSNPCTISQQTYNISPNAYNGQGRIFYNLMNNNGGNAQFRRDYLMRYQDLLNGPLRCTEILTHWQTINDLYRPEMKKHEDAGTVPFAGQFVTLPDAWDTNMSYLKRAIEGRCRYMSTAFSTSVSCYGLVGPYDLQVEVRPDNSGTVKLNTTVLPYYAWSGKYFIGQMGFKAKPIDTTFVFDHWEIENHVESNNRPLSMDSIGIYFGNPMGDKIVAVFTDRKEESALPSGFSPNGDGKNDVFGILGSGKYSREFEFRIWNRWGQEVFRTTDPTSGWDGNFNGAQAQTGVYAYHITFKNVFNEPKEYKGNVTLVR